MSAARLLVPKRMPSEMPAAMAMMFFHRAPELHAAHVAAGVDPEIRVREHGLQFLAAIFYPRRPSATAVGSSLATSLANEGPESMAKVCFT